MDGLDGVGVNAFLVYTQTAGRGFGCHDANWATGGGMTRPRPSFRPRPSESCGCSSRLQPPLSFLLTDSSVTSSSASPAAF